MRWLLVTIALLAASACLVGWVYLRDRDTNWRPPERHLAPVRRSERRASRPQARAVGVNSSEGEAPSAGGAVGAEPRPAG